MTELTEKDLENMKNHQYKTTGKTQLDIMMDPFWCKCANLLPFKYTPNMVTVSGLFCQYLAVGLIAFHDLTFSKKLPGYVYFFSAFMIFMAQTLDAIDGKHARNTKRQSSLGQLMDHGCDSMDNFLFCIVLSQAYLFGNSIQTLILELFIQVPFYIYTLEEHFSGVLRTQMNNIGVTEYQFLTMGLLIFPALFGHYLAEFSIFGIRLCFIFLYLCVLSGLYYTIYLIVIDSKNVKDCIEKFKPALTLIAFVMGELFSIKLFTYSSKPLLIILLNGLYFSLFSSKLIISNMAKKEINLFDIDIIIYIIGIILAVFLKIAFIEAIILIILVVWLILRFYFQIICAIFRMMDYLKIGF